jgi:hypothetical protein
MDPNITPIGAEEVRSLQAAGWRCNSVGPKIARGWFATYINPDGDWQFVVLSDDLTRWEDPAPSPINNQLELTLCQ